MAACGLNSDTTPQIRETEFYTSHEALFLSYEEALTRDRFDDRRLVRLLGASGVARRPHPAGRRRACRVPARHQEPDRDEMRADPRARRSAAADRPAQPGERAGPADPDHPHGRRQGRGETAAADPRRPARRAAQVVWCIDPMHGNTITSSTGYKTRVFDRILDELHGAFAVHLAEGSYAGGVHFELTGQNVTECIGGAQGSARQALADQLSDALRPAAQRQPGPGAGLRDRRGAEARAPGQQLNASGSAAPAAAPLCPARERSAVARLQRSCAASPHPPLRCRERSTLSARRGSVAGIASLRSQ